MDFDKYYKYALVFNDNANNNNISILYVSINKSDIIDFLTKHINNNFKLDNYLKAYYDNDTISIFKYHYFLPKELICKFHIINFMDIIIDK